MNTTAIAKALRDLADAIEQPSSVPAPVGRVAGVAPPAPATPYDENPFDKEYAAPKPVQDAALGVCPVHGVAWTVKAGGVSKAGKSYSAFYRCAEKTGDAYCDQKPTKVWQDTHPIREAA